MGIAAGAASLVLALNLGGNGQGATLQRVDPATLVNHGARLHLPNAMLGFAWARRGEIAAVVVKPGATGQPIRIVDVRTLRVRRVLDVGGRDVCGLTYDRAALVALAADRPCYWHGAHFEVLRFAARGMRAIPVPGLDTAWPTNLAFGDGHAFVAYAGGGVSVVDLRTGATTSHRPRRTLAKGEGLVPTRWLGGHLLGVGPAIVDVRTWRKRVIAGATGIAPAGTSLVAYGPHGATVYTRAGRRLFHLLGDESLDNVHVVGPFLYADVGEGLDVVDLRTHVDERVVPHAFPWVILAP
jgi:hypothetical protein